MGAAKTQKFFGFALDFDAMDRLWFEDASRDVKSGDETQKSEDASCKFWDKFGNVPGAKHEPEWSTEKALFVFVVAMDRYVMVKNVDDVSRGRC